MNTRMKLISLWREHHRYLHVLRQYPTGMMHALAVARAYGWAA